MQNGTDQNKRRTVVKFVRIVTVLLFLIYPLSYVLLSVFGTYQPISVRASGIKEYAWAPWGFYDADHPWPGSVKAERDPNAVTGGWNDKVETFYYPLHYLDCHFVHNSK